MKPSSKNEVMNGIVNTYIAQKVMDKTNNTHYADTWKILNGADDEIDASLKFDLSEGEWSDIKAYLKANNIAFTLCLISYKDGHSQNSFVWYDNEHIYATEMNEIGSVVFHVVDNANKEMIKPTDETSSSILKMLLALENVGANGGGGETTTKQVFKGGVDILDKPLDVKSKATFGADVEVGGKIKINSFNDLTPKTGFYIKNIDNNITYFYLSEIKVPSPYNKLQPSISVSIYDVNLGNYSHRIYVENNFGAYQGFFSFSSVYNNGDGETKIKLDRITLKWPHNNNNSTIATLADLNSKQSVLYRHTITIYEGNTQDSNSICFTAYTPSNIPIDSVQDLTASVDGSNKLANTDLECFGVSGTASALVFYNKIHVGTDLASTTLQKATGGSVALSSVYSNYTITDDVSLN